jgi:hypothetical protein
MPATDARGGGDSADMDSMVTVHESCPGRLVFTENGNPDGWIATDLTVELSD